MPRTSSKIPRAFTKRVGPLTDAEKSFIAQFAADQPRAVTPRQVTQLARLMRRSPQAIREHIERARDTFAASALEYVQAHTEAMLAAAAAGDHATAIKAAQWAMENISYEGVRLIERVQKQAPPATKIYVGLKLGGSREPEGEEPTPTLPAAQAEIN